MPTAPLVILITGQFVVPRAADGVRLTSDACASLLANESKVALYGFKVFYLAMALVGCTMKLTNIVDISYGLLFMMANPNLIGVYMLLPVLRRAVDDYDRRLASGSNRSKTRWLGHGR